MRDDDFFSLVERVDRIVAKTNANTKELREVHELLRGIMGILERNDLVGSKPSSTPPETK